LYRVDFSTAPTQCLDRNVSLFRPCDFNRQRLYFITFCYFKKTIANFLESIFDIYENIEGKKIVSFKIVSIKEKKMEKLYIARKMSQFTQFLLYYIFVYQYTFF